MTEAALAGRIPVFDLDGTLLDSDAALVAAFLACGVEESEITRGHVVADECARLGISLEDFLAAYDVSAAQPFAGVEELLDVLGSWAVCSNKHPGPARAELARLGWEPVVALFADAFAGPKTLGPVATALGVSPGSLVFVGDTGHDRRCAQQVGATFVLAAWNPRVESQPGDVVVTSPSELGALLGAG